MKLIATLILILSPSVTLANCERELSDVWGLIANIEAATEHQENVAINESSRPLYQAIEAVKAADTGAWRGYADVLTEHCNSLKK